MNIRLATAEETDALVEFNQAMALETEGKMLDPEVLARGVAAYLLAPERPERERTLFALAAMALGCGFLAFLPTDYRGVSELAILLEAVLLSARGVPDDKDPVDLGEACRRCLARLVSGEPALRDRLRVRGDGPRDVLAPRRWVASLFDVLMHRLLAAHPQASWDIVLSQAGVHIDTVSDAADGTIASGRSDLGVGIVFAERLAHALGWRIEQSPAPGGGLRVSVLLPEGARAKTP